MRYTLKEQQLLFDLQHYRDLKAELQNIDEMLKNCVEGSETHMAFSGQRENLLFRISEVERRVMSLPAPKRRLLVGRFFEGKAWGAISCDLGYSVDHCSGKFLRQAYFCYLR